MAATALSVRWTSSAPVSGSSRSRRPPRSRPRRCSGSVPPMRSATWVKIWDATPAPKRSVRRDISWIPMTPRAPSRPTRRPRSSSRPASSSRVCSTRRPVRRSRVTRPAGTGTRAILVRMRAASSVPEAVDGTQSSAPSSRPVRVWCSAPEVMSTTGTLRPGVLVAQPAEHAEVGVVVADTADDDVGAEPGEGRQRVLVGPGVATARPSRRSAARVSSLTQPGRVSSTVAYGGIGSASDRAVGTDGCGRRAGLGALFGQQVGHGSPRGGWTAVGHDGVVPGTAAAMPPCVWSRGRASLP